MPADHRGVDFVGRRPALLLGRSRSGTVTVRTPGRPASRASCGRPSCGAGSPWPVKGAARARREMLVRGRDGRRRVEVDLVLGREQVRVRGAETESRPVRAAGHVAREVEGPGEVSADLAPPGADVRLDNAEGRLEKPQQRRVVEHCRVDVTADGPRRHEGARDTEPEADRQPVARRATGRGEGHVLVRSARRGRRRQHVVEHPVVLVIGQDEQRLRPDVAIGGDRVELLRDVLGSGCREIVWVLGLGGGGNEP